MQPLLSVMLATRNGAHVLPRTLEGYCRATPPAGPWQLTVIDNGSTDDTAAIVGSFAGRLPVELISHATPGKNRALNAGISAARGQLLVFTDDDAIPDVAFLRAWEQVLGSHLDYELFGGRIEPLFEIPPPDWLSRSRSLFAMMFAERDLPEGPVPAGEIYGPNMAVRTSVFERGHRFAENIGPNASDPNYPMGSEVEFSRRIARADVESWFVRSALVRHIVRPHQWTEKAWIGRAYRNGRGQAHIAWEEGRPYRGPRVRMQDWLGLYSPITPQRYRAISVFHRARGFRDEDRRRREEAKRHGQDGTSR